MESTTPDEDYGKVITHITVHLDEKYPIKMNVPDVKYPVFDLETVRIIRARKRLLKKARKVPCGLYIKTNTW